MTIYHGNFAFYQSWFPNCHVMWCCLQTFWVLFVIVFLTIKLIYSVSWVLTSTPRFKKKGLEFALHSVAHFTFVLASFGLWYFYDRVMRGTDFIFFKSHNKMPFSVLICFTVSWCLHDYAYSNSKADLHIWFLHRS